MAALFDTGALERLRRGDREAESLAVRFYPPVIAAHVAAEFIYGLAWATAPAEVLEEGRAFLKSFELLQPSIATAEIYAQLRADLRRTGRQLPDPDYWIAAHALEGNLPLISTDHHFKAFDGLRLHLIGGSH